MGWPPETNRCHADGVVAHFSQRTREMGHPVCFPAVVSSGPGYTFREMWATRRVFVEKRADQNREFRSSNVCCAASAHVSKNETWGTHLTWATRLLFEKLDEQFTYFFGSFLLYPMAGSFDKVCAEHPRTHRLLHPLKVPGVLVDAPVALPGNEK